MTAADAAQEAARGQRAADERAWDLYERRNPGIAHPGRTAARIEAGRRARADDWVQGTAAFTRPSTLADQAREQRDRNLPAPPIRATSAPPWLKMTAILI